MTTDMDIATSNYLDTEILQRGEKIFWKGRPDPKAGAKIGSIKLLFGIFFFAFAVFWTIMASQGSDLFALFGIPFMAVGAWMVSTPLRNYWRASQTYYAITNKRILIIKAGSSFKINSITADQISDYERTDRPNGTGDIQLKQTISHGKNGPTSSVEFVDGLWGVTDVKGAAHAIGALRT